MADQDVVPRLNAALEGRYHIERQLGEGGMATVYLAADLRHGRKVALKVLKPELAAVVGADRFLAEIKTTANLQHPHILPLFDSGEADSFLFYVMPYVEGESLRERLDREHQLPVEEAVRIATNVAEALEYAHSHGVIHRDIKPANILLQAGKPVVSDFGIALAVGVAGGGRLTETGLSLGTPHYMSPEQATGDQGVGVATDIYALGAVLYEMLVGDPPYVGSTAQAILGKIIAGELASAAKQRSSVPAHVDAAIRRALEKLPADRFSDAGDFSRALADTRFRHGVAAEAPTTRRRLAWQSAAALVLGAAIGGTVVAAAMDGGRDAAPGLVQFTITPSEDIAIDVGGSARDLTVSRDGKVIAHRRRRRTGASGLRLVLRSLDQLGSTPLRGSERAAEPVFSPNGQWVGFIDAAGSRILKVSVFGGPPVVLTEITENAYGLSWGADDRIVVGTSGGLFSVAGGGGEPEALTAIDSDQGERAHMWPHVIDGEQLVLFVIALDGPELAILDLTSGEVTRLGLAGLSPRYTSTGHIVYATADGSLRAVPFDLGTREITGSPVPLVEGVHVKGSGAANFAISDNGRLVYMLGPAIVEAQAWEFVWVDREGNEEPLPMPARAYTFPRVSPDGRQIAVSVNREGSQDLWVYDAGTGAGLRLTRDDERNWVPIWTPEGHILYSSTLDAEPPQGFQGFWWGNVYSVAADGSGTPVRVSETDESQGLTGLSPNGRTMVYSRVAQTQWEIIGRPLDGSAEPRVLVSGPFLQGTGSISPDGRWLAYRSSETGQFEVYVQPFPGPGAKVPVSIGGGTQPVWSADSREIFYRTVDDDIMMSATISGEGTPQVTARTALFSAAGYRNGGNDFRQYHVAPDRRFLMMRESGIGAEDGAARAQINVVLNWFEELRERVPN